MILAAISMVIAAIVEIYRKKDIHSNGGFPQDVGGKTFNASHISIFAQAPQFVFIGMGEVFTSITG